MYSNDKGRSGVPFFSAGWHQGVGAPGVGPSGQAPNLGAGRAGYLENMETGIALVTGSLFYMIWCIIHLP